MNRSKRSDVFPSTSLPVTPGGLSVATAWWHPVRGHVDCPAHPLLSAHARRAGYTVDARPWEEAAVNGDDRGPAATTVVAVSYERPEGGHRGIALAARSEDGAAVAFAHRQITSWQSVLRTRRVLYVSEETAPSGAPAAGVRSATPAPHVPHPSASYAPVPPQGPRGSGGPGRQDRPDGGGWLACGCPAGSTCPSADSAERSLHRSVGRGDEVVVVGAPAGGTGGGWPRKVPAGTVQRARTPAQAEALAVADPERLAFVLAPGAVVSEAAGILRVLRRRFPRLRGQHPWDWCYTTDDLVTAVGSVLGQSDALLVTGSGDSPLVRTALVVAARSGVRVREVTSLDRIRPEDVDGATITVLHTAARDGHGRDLARVLDGLGPTGHIVRRVHSTALPSGLGAHEPA
ncbi:4-hydroxy-3-methylbut-2-enyl diphosphate reductase [Streptomyces sp. CB00316]|uniref:4-hydroxy-3-methylbut-2-enyl diphosphate reductase n=1 Tax=unclassified Streptomyces TaxID=2593676 RepID=UPI00093BD7CA|nr:MULTISPECIES: 4-hydroxy-3-methylbut-2-enyl diphosphate reductase [unclassified Streptomyces]MBT2377332.1 4-hydroxy-3-methylbut-2-enyl diphosphate reductase [Streptomyces sp. ISL-111]MBT2425497.1 4-hydroxy-3-methylbut-2-enyl diphosphate reductase [Streptomyces sp. ISL-112]MBT2465689.1 4-hydroxy-3-methylbut-2-enyl diphosphate reductase [Streptomyces sp. ISL-63]OKJ23652.1 4-hydroxy-3-methylbut-2-enyl diphosphate reductase [Streptomyces sp. CB00316]